MLLKLWLYNVFHWIGPNFFDWLRKKEKKKSYELWEKMYAYDICDIFYIMETCFILEPKS